MHIQRRIRRCMQKKRAPGKSLVDELVHLLNARKQRDQLKLCCVQTIEPDPPLLDAFSHDPLSLRMIFANGSNAGIVMPLGTAHGVSPPHPYRVAYRAKQRSPYRDLVLSRLDIGGCYPTMSSFSLRSVLTEFVVPVSEGLLSTLGIRRASSNNQLSRSQPLCAQEGKASPWSNSSRQKRSSQALCRVRVPRASSVAGWPRCIIFRYCGDSVSRLTKQDEEYLISVLQNKDLVGLFRKMLFRSLVSEPIPP